MRAKSIVMLSGLSVLAIPTATLACDLEGPGGRFSPFAHMNAIYGQSAQVDASATAATTYSDDSRDARTVDAEAVDYNAPPAPVTTDSEPSGEVYTR